MAYNAGMLRISCNQPGCPRYVDDFGGTWEGLREFARNLGWFCTELVQYCPEHRMLDLYFDTFPTAFITRSLRHIHVFAFPRAYVAWTPETWMAGEAFVIECTSSVTALTKILEHYRIADPLISIHVDPDLGSPADWEDITEQWNAAPRENLSAPLGYVACVGVSRAEAFAAFKEAVFLCQV